MPRMDNRIVDLKIVVKGPKQVSVGETVWTQHITAYALFFFFEMLTLQYD